MPRCRLALALGLLAPVVAHAQITNGGFEGGLAGWTVTSGYATRSSCWLPLPDPPYPCRAERHSGTYSALLGAQENFGVPYNMTVGDSSIAQTFQVPALGGTLSFWHKGGCGDAATNHVRASLRDLTTGGAPVVLLPPTCPGGDWTRSQHELLPFAGHQVELTLTSHNDTTANLPGWTYVDDVELVAATAGPPPVELELVASGLPSVTSITHAGDGRGRLFVAVADGRILIHDGEALRATPFLDLRPLVLSGGEHGLLGLVFPRRYAESGIFFVSYTRVGDGATVIARYGVSSDPDFADAASATVLLVIPQPLDGHPGGQLAIGPEGYLHFGTGDGGSGGDAPCHAQRDDSPFGKIMYLDAEGRARVWAKGLRNPRRFSFDRHTGELFIADVGEIDVVPSGHGGRNLGWPVMEGSTCTSPAPACPGVSLPACGAAELDLPELETASADGCPVTGGFLYRGLRVPHLTGTYVYADPCTGEVFSARLTDGRWEASAVLDTDKAIGAFGEDEAGELYLAHSDADGAVYRLRGPAAPFDLGGPRHPDLLWRNLATGQNFVWRMTHTSATGGSWLPTLVDADLRVVAIADLNGDRENDILWRNQATGDNLVWFLRDGAFVSSVPVTAVPDLSWQIVGAGHLDADRQPDLVWRRASTGEAYVWFMRGIAPVAGAALPTVPELAWQIVAVADFDNDGQSDLLWRHAVSGENFLWFMRGAAPARGAWLTPVPETAWHVVGAMDLSGDGRTDLVWRHATTGQDFVWFMNGEVVRGGAWFDPVADTDWHIVPSVP